MKRFVLCPGYVRSITDGDLHYISSGQLARLYGVNLRDCFVDDGKRPGYNGREFVHLFPRTGGKYEKYHQE